jgi:hypothetical protein
MVVISALQSRLGSHSRLKLRNVSPDGDIIDIFYKDEGEPATQTDLGETLRWLKMQTATLSRTPRQLQLIIELVTGDVMRSC